MKKLAVMFTGVGYTCIKPLLYYTAAMAAECGYEVLRLDYGEDVHSFKGRTPEDLLPIIEIAKERSLKQLESVSWQEYDDIVFISKSIGTTIACQVEQELKLAVRQFLMTPITATIPYLEQVQGIFFAGTSDPYIEEALILSAAEKYSEKVGMIFSGCNHSLEKKGCTENNVKNLLEILKKLEKFLKK